MEREREIERERGREGGREGEREREREIHCDREKERAKKDRGRLEEETSCSDLTERLRGRVKERERDKR